MTWSAKKVRLALMTWASWKLTSETAPMPLSTRSISNEPPRGRRLTVNCALLTTAGVYSVLNARKAAARWVVWRV